MFHKGSSMTNVSSRAEVALVLNSSFSLPHYVIWFSTWTARMRLLKFYCPMILPSLYPVFLEIVNDIENMYICHILSLE